MVAISYTMAFFDLVSRFGCNAYEKSYQIRLGRYRPFKTNCGTLFGRFDNRVNAHRSCVAKDVNHFFVLGHFFKEGGECVVTVLFPGRLLSGGGCILGHTSAHRSKEDIPTSHFSTGNKYRPLFARHPAAGGLLPVQASRHPSQKRNPGLEGMLLCF